MAKKKQTTASSGAGADIGAGAGTDSAANVEVSAEGQYCPIKADLFNRVLAKFIDFLIASVLLFLPMPIGFFAALTYLLIADGIPPKGQSIGKKLIGLKVVINPVSENPRVCNWRHSVIRNLPFVFLGFGVFGLLGFLIFFIGLVVIGFESYFVFADDQGVRLGDIFANTKVLDI